MSSPASPFVIELANKSVMGAPKAAVLKGLIDQVDGVFRLDVTHQEDKI